MLGLFQPKKEAAPVDTQVMFGGTLKSLKGEDRFATWQSAFDEEVVTFILVSDGHGGSYVSSYIIANFEKRVNQYARNGSAEGLNEAVTRIYRELHAEVCDPKFDSGEHKAGATLTVCCVNSARAEISAWNVGDSLALLVHDEGYVELGETHRLDESPQEQARVVAAGATLGRVMDSAGQPGGPIRAFPGGLAVVRGIGDADCTAFVKAEPAWVTRPTPPMGGAIIACSDGVWDHLNSEEAAAVLLAGKYSGAKSAAAQVIKKALSKVGMTDDTTAVALLFGPPAGSPDGSKEGSKNGNEMVADRGGSFNSDKPRKGSFLRHVGRETEGSLRDEDTEGSVLVAAGAKPESKESVRFEGDITTSSPLKGRSAAEFKDVTVKGGNAFYGVSFRVDDESDRADEGKMARPPPAWAAGFDADAAKSRQSVRVSDGSAKSFSPLSAEGGSPTTSPKHLRSGKFGARLSKSPGSGRMSRSERQSRRNKQSRASRLSRLFDQAISGEEWGDMDASKSSDMDGSKMSELDDSKDGSTDGSHCEGASRTSKKGIPWAGVPHMRQIVNTDPNHTWHPTSSLAPATAPSNRGLTNRSDGWLKKEESTLRSSLGNMAKTARHVEWDVLGEPMVYLGQGEFATAHRTTLDGNQVAVKMLKKAKQELSNALHGIKREIMLMTMMNHRHVLHAHGLGQHDGKPFMIVELLDATLSSELPRDPDTVPFWVRWREVKQWPLSRAVNCGLQLACALQYCHDDAFPGYRILHRDVKPNNIGFATNGDLVLFDFGLASLWRMNGDHEDDNAPRKLTGETGSMRYMAPEVANSQPYSHKAEVFSFATVLWELCAHKKPFLEYSSPELFKKAVGKGAQPKLNAKWPAELQSVLKQCWDLDAAARPEFRAVVEPLSQVLAGCIESEGAKRSKTAHLRGAPPLQPTPSQVRANLPVQKTQLTSESPSDVPLGSDQALPPPSTDA